MCGPDESRTSPSSITTTDKPVAAKKARKTAAVTTAKNKVRRRKTA